MRLVPLARRLALGFVALAALVAVAPDALAQGVLRGTVTDSLEASTLPGANVFLEGTSQGVATDVQGAFRLNNVPAGDYVVRISYVGYATKRVNVTIVSGRTVTLDVALGPDASLGEIVVTGQLAGQAAAINQQLGSNTIINVVSEERIQDFPDANAAESIGRLPGVSVQRSGGEASRIVLRGLSGGFTNITVDGVQVAATDAESRSVDLSAISQGSLAGIELFKALTPDKDADAIAGSVNLVTRRAPAIRDVRVDALGAYNGLAGDAGQYDLDFRYGERLFGNVLGLQLTGNLEQRNRSSEEYDVGYDFSPGGNFERFEVSEIELDYTDEARRRSGLGAILDVGTPDGGFVKLSTLYNYTSRNFITYNRLYPLDDLVFYSARDREQTIRLFNTALTGDNNLLGFNATWGLSLARSASEFPFDFQMTFTEPSVTSADGTPIAGMGQVPASVRADGDPAAIIPYAVNNYDLAFLYTGVYRDETSTDTDRTGFLNLSRDYTVGTGLSGQFRIGGKYRDKSRSRERTERLSPYYNSVFPTFVRYADGTIGPKDFTGTPFETLRMGGQRVLASNFVTSDVRDLYGRFSLAPIVDRDALRAWWDLNGNGYRDAAGRTPEFAENLEASAFFYDIAERVTAGYAMSTLNVGQRVTWIAGLRVEQENNDYASRYSPFGLDGVPVPSGAIRDTSATHTETVWLPNTHLAVRATDFLTVRLAAYRALARPDFNRRLASAVARRNSFFYSGNAITLGNPSLRAAKAWNYEANASLFGPRLGLFSVSLFYKDIEDYFHTLNNLPFSGNAVFDSLGIAYESPFGPAQFALTAPYNSARPTTVYGVEVEHQGNLGFLRGPLAGIVYGYNLSVVRSSTYIPRVRVETTFIERPPFPPIPQVAFILEDSEQKLQQQPDFIANLSLGYDFRAFSARASLFHQDRFNTSFAANPQTGNDGVRGGFTRVDLSFRQGIGERASLLLNVNNLTGVEEQSLSYNSVLDRTLVNTSQIYGTTVDLGFRLRF